MAVEQGVIARVAGRLARFDQHRLGVLAQQGRTLSETIRDRATEPHRQKKLRTLPGTECVQYLGGINVETLYRRLKKNPDLPQGIEVNKRRRDFSLEDLHRLQDAFGIRPPRQPGQQGVVVSICNLKGGVGKTTTTAHLAQYLCLHGYRVVALDLDAQASLTQLSGLLPHIEVANEQTIRPVMDGPFINDEPYGVADQLTAQLAKAARNYIDRRDLASGPGALKILDERLAALEAHYKEFGPEAPRAPNPEYRGDLLQHVQSTHWHELDLIPANLGVYGSEFSVASRIASKESGFAFYRIMAEHMAGLREKYDVILLDTAPSLSFINSNAMFAADALLVTLPPAQMDVASVSLFFDLMAEVLETINRVEEHPKDYDFGAILLTKYLENNSSHKDIASWVRSYYPDETLTHEMVHTQALEKIAAKLLTLYEAGPSDYDGDRRTFERALDSMNQVNAEITTLIRSALDARNEGLVAAAVAPRPPEALTA